MSSRSPTWEHRIVVLHGKDSFLKLEWTTRLRESLREKHGGADEFEFDGTSASLATVLDELRSYGLMTSHKLVIVDNADAFFAAEPRRRAMEQYAKEPMKEATLLLRSQNWRPGNFDKLASQVGIILKCESPSESDAMRWCVARCEKAHKLPMCADAAALLVERVGCDLAKLDSELGKLAVAALGAGLGQVSRSTVVELVGASREEQAWEIQESVLSGITKDAATKLLELLRQSRAPEVMVSWSLIDLTRKIHAASVLLARGAQNAQIARELRLWGASTEPIISSARVIGTPRAGELLHLAVEVDRRMKSGSASDGERALLGLCTTLSSAFARKSSR